MDTIWIDPKDDLPEIEVKDEFNECSRSVLVKDEGGQKYVAWRSTAFGTPENHYFTSDIDIDPVIGWMELPD